jgi:hypothetical protein
MTIHRLSGWNLSPLLFYSINLTFPLLLSYSPTPSNSPDSQHIPVGQEKRQIRSLVDQFFPVVLIVKIFIAKSEPAFLFPKRRAPSAKRVFRLTSCCRVLAVFLLVFQENAMRTFCVFLLRYMLILMPCVLGRYRQERRRNVRE